MNKVLWSRRRFQKRLARRVMNEHSTKYDFLFQAVLTHPSVSLKLDLFSIYFYFYFETIKLIVDTDTYSILADAIQQATCLQTWRRMFIYLLLSYFLILLDFEMKGKSK